MYIDTVLPLSRNSCLESKSVELHRVLSEVVDLLPGTSALSQTHNKQFGEWQGSLDHSLSSTGLKKEAVTSRK